MGETWRECYGSEELGKLMAEQAGLSMTEEDSRACLQLLLVIREWARKSKRKEEMDSLAILDRFPCWPLAFDRCALFHIGDVSVRGRNKQLLPLLDGDFYFCAVSRDGAVQLEMCVFEKYCQDFCHRDLPFEEVLTMLSSECEWKNVTHCLMMSREAKRLIRCELSSSRAIAFGNAHVARAIEGDHVVPPHTSVLSTNPTSTASSDASGSMKKPLRYIGDLDENVIKKQLILIHGSRRLWDSQRVAFIEIHPFPAHAEDNAVMNGDFPISTLVALLQHLQILYRRSVGACEELLRFVLLVNCKPLVEVDSSHRARFVDAISATLNSYLCVASSESTIARVIWIDLSSRSSIPLFENVQNDFLSLSEVHQLLERTNCSTRLGGLIDPEITIHWFLLHEKLDQLYKNSRDLGARVENLHMKMEATSADRITHQTEGDALTQLQLGLSMELDSLEASSCFRFLLEEGDLLCDQVSRDFPMLRDFDSHLHVHRRESVLKLYRAVMTTTLKARPSVQKRLNMIEQLKRAFVFRREARKLSEWLERELLPDLEKLYATLPSVNAKMLNSQSKNLENYKTQIIVIHDLLTQNEDLITDAIFNDNERLELATVWNELNALSANADRNVAMVDTRIDENLQCLQMYEQVFDWLLAIKKIPLECMAIDGCVDDGQRARMGCLLAAFPREQLKRLPVLAESIRSDQLVNRARELDQEARLALKSAQGIFGADVDETDEIPLVQAPDGPQDEVALPPSPQPPSSSRAMSPTPTDYERPICRAVPCTSSTVDEEEIRWRRSSAYGSSHGNRRCSMGESPTTYQNRFSALYRQSDDESDEEDGVLNRAPITVDMTTTVIDSMSASTLAKRMCEKRLQSAAVNPLALMKGVRAGSARYFSSSCGSGNLVQRSIRKMSRASTLEMGDDSEVFNATAAAMPERSRRSLASISEDSLHGSLLGFADDLSSSNPGCSSPFVQCEYRTIDDAIVQAVYASLAPEEQRDADEMMQARVMKELIETEFHYVAGLSRIVEHYIPQLDDAPVDLRGKRGVLFANVEQIFQLHAYSLLPAILDRMHSRGVESSLAAIVARLFYDMRHGFRLYALYSKNKPKSDALMREYGTAFFKSKQAALGDPLDLSSYLLTPIQRMGKYGLLLEEMAKTTKDQETGEMLRRARQIVAFQQRHGNDLLAMDLIVGCSINLKEQGQLIRQDELLVTRNGLLHNRKCRRRVFLFEKVVLFTKPETHKATLVGLGRSHSTARSLSDVYRFKDMLQMSDCGLTPMLCDSKVKFELWFRRLTKPSTYIIQTPSENVRQQWVEDIQRLLWRQAKRNRSERHREHANMGIGSRAAYVDLQRGCDRIEDRSVNPALICHGRLRNSMSHFCPRVADVATAQGNKRPHSLVSLSSSSGASSNASSAGNCRTHTNTPSSLESGICTDLDRVEEEDDSTMTWQVSTHA